MEDQEEEPRNYLGNLGQQIKRHWQEHRPRLYCELEQRGQLHQAPVQAQNQTSDSLHSLLKQGAPYDRRGRACGRSGRSSRARRTWLTRRVNDDRARRSR